MLLVIDNYDSFTWNLIQYLKILNIPFCIRANDEIDANFVISLNPSGVLLSPGPGEPKDAGNCIDIVKKISKNKFESIPVLGVCLGHQIIAEAFGGSIRKAKSPMHGKISSITNIQTDIFINCIMIDTMDTFLMIEMKSGFASPLAIKHLRNHRW